MKTKKDRESKDTRPDIRERLKQENPVEELPQVNIEKELNAKIEKELDEDLYVLYENFAPVGTLLMIQLLRHNKQKNSIPKKV